MALESLTVDEREGTREATTLRQPPVERESPVFADLSGRRGRVFRVIGRALVVVLVLWLAAVGAGLAGLGTLPGVPELGSAEQSAPRESRSPGDTTPAADRAPPVRSPSTGRERVETSPPATDSPARAPQRRPDAATPRRTRVTPPATRSPRSTAQTQPQQAPPAPPRGRPAEPPTSRRPSPPPSPQQGPPPHSQAPAAVKDGPPEPGQGRRPQE
jgi:hypothetical protein